MALMVILEIIFVISCLLVLCNKKALAGYKIFNYSMISGPFVALIVCMAVFAILCASFLLAVKLSRRIACIKDLNLATQDFWALLMTVILSALAAVGPYLMACNAYGCVVAGKGFSMMGSDISMLLAPMMVMLVSWITVIALVHATFDRQNSLIEKAKYIFGLQFVLTFIILFGFI